MTFNRDFFVKKGSEGGSKSWKKHSTFEERQIVNAWPGFCGMLKRHGLVTAQEWLVSRLGQHNAETLYRDWMLDPLRRQRIDEHCALHA